MDNINHTAAVQLAINHNSWPEKLSSQNLTNLTIGTGPGVGIEHAWFHPIVFPTNSGISVSPYSVH